LPLLSYRVQIQKEVISDLMRENQFLSIDMGVYTIDLQRGICKPNLKLDFKTHDIMESLSEFGLCVRQAEKRRKNVSWLDPGFPSNVLFLDGSSPRRRGKVQDNWTRPDHHQKKLYQAHTKTYRTAKKSTAFTESQYIKVKQDISCSQNHSFI
jgi:hypothetical protein